MWIQTWHPRHPVYAALRAHDYPAFAQAQLIERQAAGLPPFASLALLRADARTAEAATAFLEEAGDLARAHGGVSIYAPVPPHVARVAGVERMQLLLESASRPALQAMLTAWLPGLHGLRARHKGLLRWAVDVDPMTI
jgi:primosomal protein N' (replication factor Y)